MKPMTPSEKLYLIRKHGEDISKTGMAVISRTHSEVIENAKRVIELARSVPKDYWADER